ncbi:MAG: nucleotidyl transferase AbiEii/AbiGii toxin family protein [Thiotrichaceae bacterium]|nr:nucleotidyl transferase AbiEii/AbiGii toxin family protein [Thiotrichaceae bacterium]
MSIVNDNKSTLDAIAILLNTLYQSPFYSDYAVRGSYISRQWMHPYSRHCHDLDLLYLKDYHAEDLIEQVRYLATHSETKDIHFQADAIAYEKIWAETISPGIRFLLPYSVTKESSDTKSSQSHTLQVDIACHDPLSCSPIEQVIEQPPYSITLQTIPLETLTAWKLHGLFEHINGPWQSKTLWDLYLFCRYNTLDIPAFILATKLAFSSRLDPIEIINRLLIGDFGRSKKSAKYWKTDFPNFTTAPFIPITDVIQWLQDYLNPIFNFNTATPLLTLADIIRYRIQQLRTMPTQQTQVKQKLKTLSQKRKILSHKAYYTIHHLPTSRLGSSERCISTQQNALLTNSDFHQESHTIIVQEKLDGSCVCAYRKDDEIFALGREGDLADSSPNESRRLWADWVAENEARFMAVLNDGERLCGEWLAMVHGTHYNLTHEPFVAFDLFTLTNKALNYNDFRERIDHVDAAFIAPHLIHYGTPYHLELALKKLGTGHHGSTDNAEGLIWRLERNQRPAFKAKYVRHDKEDGCYLTEKTGQPEQWNWYKD